MSEQTTPPAPKPQVPNPPAAPAQAVPVAVVKTEPEAPEAPLVPSVDPTILELSPVDVRLKMHGQLVINKEGKTEEVFSGYQMVGADEVQLDSGKRITADTLTHAQALYLLVKEPSFFKKYVRKAQRPAKDPYWQKQPLT
jgi:hypothetical protein